MENENKIPDANSKVPWWKALLAKKWAFPALYLAASVLIVTLLWTRIDTGGNYQLSKEDSIFNEQQQYQQEQPDQIAQQDSNTQGEDSLDASEQTPEEAVPVTSDEPQVMWPLEITDQAKIVHQFYDQNASDDVRLQAIYEYNNTMYTNNGIDIIKDGEKFEVYAVADGKVVMAENDVLHGKKIKISHGEDFETVYASLSEMTVEVGDEVKAGEVIGQAGKSEIKSSLPNHLYFEAYKAGEPVDPVSVLPAISDPRT